MEYEAIAEDTSCSETNEQLIWVKLNKRKIFFVNLPLAISEADVGLLQHPRWSALQ